MWAIIFRTIKDYIMSLVIYIVAAIGFIWMYIALFPSMSQQSAQLEAAFQNYPKDMFKAMNIEMSDLTFDNIQSFLSMENFSIMWPIMVIAMTISLASNAIAGEIEKGTIGIYLAQPISRIKLYLSKYAAGMINIIIFTLISSFIAIPLAEIHNVDYEASHYFIFLILGLLFGWAIYSLAMMLSAILSEKGRVIFITLGILLVMYAINVVAALKDNLQNLKYVTFFHYYDQKNALVNGKLDDLSILVFLGVIIVCSILGAWIFSKRDISI